MSEEFIELKAPELGVDGWYVATNEYRAGWLTIHGDITSDTSDGAIKLLYHKTEADILWVMARYYERYGKVYAGAILKSLADTKTDIESQVMTF